MTPADYELRIRQEILKLTQTQQQAIQNSLRGLQASNATAAEYQVIWQQVVNLVDQLSDDLDSINVSFKRTVTELSNAKYLINQQKSGLDKLANVARDILEVRRGESVLDDKKKKSIEDQIQKGLKILQTTKSQLEGLGTLDPLQAQQLQHLEDQIRETNTIIEGQEKILAIDKEINKQLGFMPKTAAGIDKALSKLGLPDLGLNKAIEETHKLGQEQKALGNDFNTTKTYLGLIKDNIGSAFTKANMFQFALMQMIDALSKADKETGELAKAFGTSYNSATNLRNELNTIANLSGDVNITTSALQKSLIAVNKEFGTATMFSGELLKDFTQLTEVAGYTNDAAARLSKISVATGTDLSKNTAKILGQAQAFNATNKLALNEKEIVEEVAKASKATTLSLGMQPGKLTQAVLAAKALGSSLEKVESISQSLLNFESSISSELEAELLTGKNLNLERARMYALNNDIEGVAREIAGQIGSASDFTEMNVIQQEALAKSVGMTREDLASSLIERQALSKIGEGDKTAAEAYNRLKKEGLTDDQIAAKLGDKKLADQLKSQSVQERFNASIEKLKEIFVSLAGPILQIVSPIVDLLLPAMGAINFLLTPIFETFKGISSILTGNIESLNTIQTVLGTIGIAAGLYYGVLGMISLRKANMLVMDEAMLYLEASKKAGILSTIGALTIQLGIQLGLLSASLATNAALTFGVGVAIAVAAAAAGYAAIKALTADDMISSPEGYGKRTLLAPEGAIALNDNDTVIAGTNLGGKKSSSSVSSDMSRVEALLSQLVQKQDRPVQVSVEMDGEKVAKGVGNNSTKLGTSMSTNTYKVQ
jgi:hypothetical protein